MSQYKQNFVWTGRDDTEDGGRGKRWHHAVNTSEKASGVSLVGFACDIGVRNNKGRLGAAKGPDAIRQALANLAFHVQTDVEDAGTIVAEDSLVQAQNSYAMLSAIKQQLDKQTTGNVGLGGGHEIAWGSYNGMLQAHPDANIGIINFRCPL